MSPPRGLPLEHAPPAPFTIASFVRATLCAALMTACSSAAGIYEGDGANDTTGPGSSPVSGGSPSEDGVSAGDPSGAGGTTGWYPDGSGGESTGGESGEEPPSLDIPEPIDALDTEKFEDISTCDPDAKLTWRMALRDGDAMSSPSQAREAVLGQWLSLMGVQIRPWEFLNYYSFAYPAADPGALRAAGQMAAVEDEPDATYALQIGVVAPALADADRPPLHLTLALDNSGSMEGKALALLRSACKALASRLRAGDTVSLVTWNLKNAALLEGHVVSGPDDPTLLAKIDLMEVGGSAALYNGLNAAYKLAVATYVPEDINRVIVISDGGSVASESELALVAEHAQTVPGKPGIHLVGVGVGDPGTYRADLIDAIASAGLGPTLFVGSEDEAERQFEDRFLTNVVAAAVDVAVRVELPPGLEFVRAEPPEANSTGALPERAVVAVNDNVVLQRRLRTCGAVDLQSAIKVELQWIDPVNGQSKATWTELELAEMLAGDTSALVKADAVLAYAEALRAHQGLTAKGDDVLARAMTRLQAAMSKLPSDPELAEIAAVLSALQEEK